jgi:prohibitin 2
MCCITALVERYCCVCFGAQVDRATQDKQSAIVRAQGEAQSARLIGQAIQQNPSFITLRKIEVCLAAADRDVMGCLSC